MDLSTKIIRMKKIKIKGKKVDVRKEVRYNISK